MEHPKIRYATLPPNKIFNWMAPGNVTLWNYFSSWRDTWWTEETVQLRNECEQVWITAFDKMTNHFTKLEESILKTGIQHPIKVVTGAPFEQSMSIRFPNEVIPPDMRDNVSKVLSTHQYGGSRLYLAQKLNIPVPCLIYDYYDSYENYPEVNIDEFGLKQRAYYRMHKYENGIKTLVAVRHLHFDGVGGNTVPRNQQNVATDRVVDYLKQKGITNV